MSTFSRRDAMSGGAAAAAAAAFGGITGGRPARADEGAAGIPASVAGKAAHGAGVYHFKVGDIGAAVVSDGSFRFPTAHPLFGANATADEVNRALANAFLPPEDVTAHVNALVLRVGNQVVLVDAGCGGLFGPTTGKALANLARIGIRPPEVAAVVITHAHGDHVGGLLDERGEPTFPDAQHFAHKDEIAFWTAPDVDLSRATIPDDMKRGAVATAAKTFAALRGKLEPIEGGKRIVEGVEAVPAPGHTPGHTALLVASGGSQLLYVTDAAHHPAINFPHPEWHVGFDVDPVQAARARRAILDRAAADRVPVSGAHLPFPAIGHVRQAGDGFEWVPAVWEWAE